MVVCLGSTTLVSKMGTLVPHQRNAPTFSNLLGESLARWMWHETHRRIGWLYFFCTLLVRFTQGIFGNDPLANYQESSQHPQQPIHSPLSTSKPISKFKQRIELWPRTDPGHFYEAILTTWEQPGFDWEPLQPHKYLGMVTGRFVVKGFPVGNKWGW